ncbi:exosome complex exonuclease RRP6 [Mytilus galloprovincialis]|uniref:Exosome complex component 10 n=1 Tax=Mytilus galloprovincialis TaxID=29158 RepID=A0A8B6BR65_MYTGA|nr:exosome complex exonuclease RRP6 [Mytilus galloprovincialis]
MSEEKQTETEEEFLPGFDTLTNYTQQALTTALQATKCSNDLPATGDDFDYYSSYQGVREVLDIEGNRILNIIQSILKYQSVKGNLTGNSSAVDLEDKFDVLIDANDQILERVGGWLDEASGIKKKETTLVVASATPKHNATASWNKKSSPGQGNNLSSYRLLTARNIQRPQMRFRDKIDNVNRPFVPCIRYKPNAMKTLEVIISESLQLPEDITPEMTENPAFQYPHPYQHELAHLKPLQKSLNVSAPMDPKPLGETECMIVTNLEELKDLCNTLMTQEEIAIDLEHHSYRSFQGLTCLMQISTRTNDYIIDTLELRNETTFNLNHVQLWVKWKVISVQVLHGADMDIGWLQRDLGLYIINMFDTGQAARVLNMARHSLAHLLQVYCQVEADKQYQLADWRIRPLPEELIKYAREDTHYLLYIYDKMRNELIERGNEQNNLLHSVIQKSTRVCSQVYRKPIYTDGLYMELYKKSKKVFNSRQLASLKNLYSWRDRIARVEDESIGYVLPNHMLLQISEILPRERQGVLACCNPIPPLVRQYLIEIHNIIMEAREVPLTTVSTPKIKEPSMYKHPKYNPDSLLNCTHDMSYQQKYQDLGNTPCLLDPTLLKENPTMFGNSKENITILKKKPLLTVFENHSPKEFTRAQRMAAAITATFVSPITQYLPETKDGKHEQVFNNWMLMKHTAVKRKEAPPTPATSSGPPAAKRQKVEVKDTGDLLQPFGKLKSGHGRILGKDTDIETSRKKKKKRKMEEEGELQLEEEEEEEEPAEDFTPYDYSKVNLNIFEGGTSKEGKKKVFDPNAGMRRRGRGSKVYKPQFSTAKSQKSSTFGKMDKSQRQQIWPK